MCSIAVQFVTEPEICHGTGFWLGADARVLMQRPLLICLECRSRSKKCDKQLTFIVRVGNSYLVKLNFQAKSKLIRCSYTSWVSGLTFKNVGL